MNATIVNAIKFRLTIKGISKDFNTSIFKLMSKRYIVILKTRLVKHAYIVNGQIKGLAKNLTAKQVKETLEKINTTPQDTLKQRPLGNARIPAFLP